MIWKLFLLYVLGPVSYTHLDVYKRQSVGGGLQLGLGEPGSGSFWLALDWKLESSSERCGVRLLSGSFGRFSGSGFSLVRGNPVWGEFG